MNILMTGIDYNKATVEQREKFALTKSAQENMLKAAAGTDGVLGCIVISTCNRLELWLSCQEDGAVLPGGIIRDFFGIDARVYNTLFSERSGMAAVRHLFELACGLKSLVFGEDQILSQVKDALTAARECGAADPVLEALFRRAVTAAKKVKTRVPLYAVSRSAAQAAVALAKERLGELAGIRCLVIGSGEMGRLAARELLGQGAEVVMTLRRSRTGETVVPSGCKAIDYEQRYEAFTKARLVVSATRSPHFTLQADKVRELAGSDKKLLMDLALPRDIDPEIAGLPGIRLCDIDHLTGGAAPEAENGTIAKVSAIIGEELGEFLRWYEARDLMPRVNEISARASVDVEERLRHSLKKTALDEATREEVTRLALLSVEKVIRKTVLELSQNNAEIFGVTGDIAEPENAGLGCPKEKDGPPPRFPLYVDLSGKEVAVIGGGNIACRRIGALLPFPCRVTVVAKEAREELFRLSEDKKLALKLKEYETSDIENAYMVVAATDDRELNHRIALDAGRNGQFCSIADSREECTFYFPATVPYDGGVIGICGTGDNHAGTKRMADEIREFIKSKERT